MWTQRWSDETEAEPLLPLEEGEETAAHQEEIGAPRDAGAPPESTGAPLGVVATHHADAPHNTEGQDREFSI